MCRKVYVAVNATFEADGTLTPREVIWENGTVYVIDRIFDVRPAASLKTGGGGVRYTCGIRGVVSYLFYEGDRWFVEAKTTR